MWLLFSDPRTNVFLFVFDFHLLLFFSSNVHSHKLPLAGTVCRLSFIHNCSLNSLQSSHLVNFSPSLLTGPHSSRLIAALIIRLLSHISNLLPHLLYHLLLSGAFPNFHTAQQHHCIFSNTTNTQACMYTHAGLQTYKPLNASIHIETSP